MQNFEPTGAAAAMPGSAVPQIKRRLAISACLLIPLFYLGLGAAFGLPLPPFLTGDNAMWCGIVQLVLTVPVCWQAAAKIKIAAAEGRNSSCGASCVKMAIMP